MHYFGPSVIPRKGSLTVILAVENCKYDLAQIRDERYTLQCVTIAAFG